MKRELQIRTGVSLYWKPFFFPIIFIGLGLDERKWWEKSVWSPFSIIASDFYFSFAHVFCQAQLEIFRDLSLRLHDDLLSHGEKEKKLLCSSNSDTGRANLLILLNKLRTKRLNASEQMKGRVDKKLFIH